MNLNSRVNPKSFESTLLELVHEELMVLGESPRAAIYFRMERDYSLKKDEIPQRLADFSAAIRKIFGQAAPVIERLILRALCKEFNVNYESVKHNEFQSVVEEVRKRSDAPM